MESYRLILQLNNAPNAEFRFWDRISESFRSLPLASTVFNQISGSHEQAAKMKAIELFKKAGYDLKTLKWEVFWEIVPKKFQYIEPKYIE